MKKRKSFIPRSLRPDVVGSIVSVSQNDYWKELQDLINNIEIKDIKDLAFRRKAIAKILGNPDMLSNDTTKPLIDMMQHSFLS